MSVTIHIPTPLRPYVSGQDEVKIDTTGSIQTVLASFIDTYPSVKKHIFTDDNQIRKFLNIYVNDEDIRYQNQSETLVKSGDTVSIVPSIAGGQA